VFFFFFGVWGFFWVGFCFGVVFVFVCVGFLWGGGVFLCFFFVGFFGFFLLGVFFFLGGVFWGWFFLFAFFFCLLGGFLVFGCIQGASFILDEPGRHCSPRIFSVLLLEMVVSPFAFFKHPTEIYRRTLLPLTYDFPLTLSPQSTGDATALALEVPEFPFFTFQEEIDRW